ncbi:MAG: polysaccharide pyruvyl transferase family protein [Chitinophagales bacterium]
MNVLIVGWYGTETIGDRGILAGILSLIRQQTDQKVDVQVGSLFPFFTERTLKEDIPFYKKYSNCDYNFEIVDSTNIKALEKAILKSDWVIMGGGPLMHISQLYIIEYAFKYAQKKGKKTMIFGCGVGPMHKKRFVRSLKRILNHADEIILRDSLSLDYLKSLYGTIKWNIQIGIDPAAQAALDFLKHYKKPEEIAPYIAINFRKFPTLYGNEDLNKKIDNTLKEILIEIDSKFEAPIELIPMHYFHVGDDDREILTTLKFKCDPKKIEVQNVPLSLEETFAKFHNAEFCLGMRFHSVLFQTIVNQKNYVLDYTEKSVGKISGFINMVNGEAFYKNRYILLQDIANRPQQLDLETSNDVFPLDHSLIQNQLNIFKTMLAKYL